MKIVVKVHEPDVAVYGTDEAGSVRGVISVHVTCPAVQYGPHEWLGEKELQMDTIGACDEAHIVSAVRAALQTLSDADARTTWL